MTAKVNLVERFFGMNMTKNWTLTNFDPTYSVTSIIQTPLSTGLILACQVSEIVQITEVPTFLTRFMIPSLKTIPIY